MEVSPSFIIILKWLVERNVSHVPEKGMRTESRENQSGLEAGDLGEKAATGPIRMLRSQRKSA